MKKKIDIIEIEGKPNCKNMKNKGAIETTKLCPILQKKVDAFMDSINKNGFPKLPNP